MRYIRYAFLASLALALMSVALANRGDVTLQLLPDGLSDLFGLNWRIEMPLFIVVFGSIVAGLVIGFVWEWLREHKHRAEAARKGREAKQLQREVSRLKTEKAGERDEVLALLDDGR
ncbi:MAG: LapA family protein [Rhodobacteraceae bacterium]|nr:MAG: LapA family protein [Paracoccaceae bacterium]